MLSEQSLWYILIGALLVSVDVLGPLLANRWVSSVQLQLLGGIVAGPWCLGLIELGILSNAHMLEVLSEIAVIISLYATGIKMRIPLTSGRWIPPLILATLTMATTIALASGLALWLLGLSLPAAILLAAVLAPTDPVLADKIQIKHPHDKDRLRQSLTGEAGLNDGTAFPFVLLAIGLAAPNLHELGPSLSTWVAVDLLWKISGGVIFGALAGTVLGRLILWVRQFHKEPQGREELLTMGLIAVVYGIALTLNTYAFLAVFAAAVGLRRMEMNSDDHLKAQNRGDKKQVADETDHSAACIQESRPGGPGRATAGETLHQSGPQSDRTDPEADPSSEIALLKEQTEVGSALERIVQVFLVFVVGVLLSTSELFNAKFWLFAVILICVIRPLAVFCTLRLRSITTAQRGLIGWFGIRGIGTIYYLSHSVALGMDRSLQDEMAIIASCCVVTITLSIAVHGSSDAPLMRWYAARNQHSGAA